MDLPTAQHQDMEMETHSVENMMLSQNSKGSGDNQVMRKARPQAEQALKCPRCDSTNTKFCYYNNYSLSQPRYFCKSCRRYWTQGGTLRNVPVGGGCRKNKRSSSSSTTANNNSSASANSSKKSQDHPFAAAALPHLSYDHHTANDLTLAFARLHKNSCGTGPTFNDFDFSVLGSMPNADLFNAFAYNSSQPALYYGNDNHNHIGGIQTSGDQMRLQPYDQDRDQDHHHPNQYSNATTTATTVTTMKQELFGGREMNYNWGYLNWQMNNNSHHNNTSATDNHSNTMMMPMDFDSTTAARTESWNNNAFNNASSWHGLLNSPLM